VLLAILFLDVVDEGLVVLDGANLLPYELKCNVSRGANQGKHETICDDGNCILLLVHDDLGAWVLDEVDYCLDDKEDCHE